MNVIDSHRIDVDADTGTLGPGPWFRFRREEGEETSPELPTPSGLAPFDHIVPDLVSVAGSSYVGSAFRFHLNLTGNGKAGGVFRVYPIYKCTSSRALPRVFYARRGLT
jgi:hypothetical protein